MIVVGEKEDGAEINTKEFELDNELSIITKKNILPPRIIKKIGDRIKESKIEITKEQLYKLVEKIQEIIQTYERPGQFERHEVEKHVSDEIDRKMETVINEENTDMKKIADTVEQLKERIKIIEENRLDGIKGAKGRIIKTKDVKSLEKIDFLGEEMQPLEEVPNDPESIVVLMKWLQYLVDKTGKNNLPDVLGYYVDIDWISDDVRLDLIKYSKGIIDENIKEGVNKESVNLSTKDHIQSLLFIQKLKGIHLDERFMFRIDREMEKLAKSIEDYQTK